MPTSPLSVAIQHLLAGLGPDGDGMTDGELLARFVRSRDEDALAALVRRHSSLVWGVCRRLLNHHDAEDAFQATVLVLVRKAAAVPREAVANWLYGVARQTAVRLRATAAKRRRREIQAVNMPEPTVPEGADAGLQSVVDEEVSRLPGHYRTVIVLCELEGMTRRGAARQLGIPEGSVASRLARARAMLARRLNRRAVVFSGSVAAVLPAGSASASAPPALVASTIKAANLLAAWPAAIVSARVAALTEGVLKTMFVSKLKAALSVVGILAVMATGATLLSYRTAAGQEEKKPTAAKPVEQPAKQGLKLAALPPKVEKEMEQLTAWGKEVGGLQAGLGYEHGEKRVHRPGQTVKLFVRVRNVGKEVVSFQYLRHFFIENPPTVTDDKGKAVTFKDGSPRGIYKPVDATLAPGKEVELYELGLALRDKATDTPQASTLHGEGKFRLQYERVLGDSMLSSVSIKTDPALRTLATGTLELEVKDADGKKKPTEKEPATKPRNDKDANAVLKRLKGRWTLFEVLQTQGNRKVPREEGLRFDFTGATFRHYRSDRPVEDGAVEVNLTRNPPNLRLRFRKPDGTFSGAELAGPMELRSDDELWIAIPDTSIRPTAEAVLAGQARVVWKLQRTPAEKKPGGELAPGKRDVVTKGAAEKGGKPAPELDRTSRFNPLDPGASLKWFKDRAIAIQNAADNGNELAAKVLTERTRKEVLDHKEVEWLVPVSRIGLDGITLGGPSEIDHEKRLEYSIRLARRPAKDLHAVPDDEFQKLEKLPTPTADWVLGLKKGDVVRVKGKVTDSVLRVDQKFPTGTLWISLDNIEIQPANQPKGKDEPPAAKSH